MILAVNVTEGCRQSIIVILIILHIMSIVCGGGLCAVGFFLRTTLKGKVNLVEGYDVDVLPILLMVVGGLTALVHLIGGKVVLDVGSPIRRKRLRILLLVVMVLIIVVKLALLTAGSMCFAHRHHLTRSFHHGLVKAMEKYQTDHHLKHEMDLLQLQFKCCGNEGYEDWFEIQWVHNNFLDLTNKKVQSKMTSGQYLSDDVPFSCCRRDAPRPCIHHQVQDNDNHFRYNYETDHTLNQMGCKEAIMMFFGSKLNKIGGAAMILMGIQILGVLLIRYLQTSISTAIDGGDPEMPSPGYLCPGGDASAGKGLMNDRGVSGPPLKGTYGVGQVTPTGSMEDFKAHDLDMEDPYDSIIDDSTFDDVSEEPIYENIPGQDMNQNAEYGEVWEEPIYENVQGTAQMQRVQDMQYASEPVYQNVENFAQQLSQLPIEDDYLVPMNMPAKPNFPPPPPPISGIPAQRPLPQRPVQPSAGQGGRGPKPSRPSQPPSRGAGGSAATKGAKPPRPSQPPSRAPQSKPKTSTPKKQTTSQKSFPKSKKISTKSPKSKSPSKGTKRHSPSRSGSKPKKKIVKSKPAARRSPKRSSPKTKKTKVKSVKRSSPKRSSKTKRSRKGRSKNRNNNILDAESLGVEQNKITYLTNEDSDWEEELSESGSISSTSVESFDFDSDSSFDDSDASTDTPLLR